ncbi:MAG: hypothetical protein H6Q89_1651, partial [Myxococcaceae bacterium]|nr:hypothetical protein [Myxococcaceae bacterium]
MRADRVAAAIALLCSVAASGAELTVEVTPPYLQLGAQPQAQLAISGPQELADVSVTVNHGTIAAVKQLGPGRFVAEYRAPGQTFPRVAIIAVVGSVKGARIHGWTTIPLWGSAEAVLQTAPNASVSVRIGERTFGPIRADAKGIGKLPVVVPPGVQSGFYGAKVLDLGLPRVALTHLALDSPELRGDRAQAVVARFYAVTDDGKPRTGLLLRARATLGTITDFKPEAPGVYSARWSLPESAPVDAELSAWSPADPNSPTSARLRLLSGPAVRVALTAAAERWVAGTPGEVKLTARVTDARGNPTADAPAFRTTLGALGPGERDREGAWTASLRLPRGFGGAAAAVVQAEVAGVPAAQVAIALQPGPAQRLEADPGRLSVVSDGAQSVELSARLLDLDGNPVEGRVEATAPIGELRVLPGAHYQYRPPRLSSDGSTELVLSSNGLSARVPVELRAAPARLTLAPKLGFLSNLGNANALAVALALEGWLGAHLGLGLEAGYLFVPRDSVVTSGPLLGTRVLVRAHGVPVLAAVAWRGKLSGAIPLQATA